MNTIKAWVAKAAKQPMVLETVDLGPLGVEDVEVAVEYCGLCHSDISVWTNEWGILRERTRASNCSRCATVNTTARFGPPIAYPPLSNHTLSSKYL